MSNNIHFLGRSRRLFYTLEAYSAVSAVLSMGQGAISAALMQRKPDPRVMAALLWAGLIHEDPDLRPEAVIAEFAKLGAWKRFRIGRAMSRALREYSRQLDEATQSVLKFGKVLQGFNALIGKPGMSGAGKPASGISGKRRR